MFEVKNLSLRLNDRYLVENLSFVLNQGDKMALIGEEGNGKSTFLKSILSQAPYVEKFGHIQLNGNKIGYLEQSLNKEDALKCVYDFLFENEQVYYEKSHSFYRYLNSFNLDEEILTQTLASLSGGESVKIRLLKLLLEDCDLLFLDEPTNDLDLCSLEWIENFIKHTMKPVLYVSHDETLLVNTANRILHFEQVRKKTLSRHTIFNGGYKDYVSQRLKKIEIQTDQAKFEKRKINQQQEKLNKIMQKVEYQQNSISRKDPHGAKVLKKKMHALKTQEKKLGTMEITEIPDVEESINFCFDSISIPNSKRIIHIELPKLEINNKLLVRNINLDIVGPVHLAITGKNGVGKSTLLKIIYERLKNRTDIMLGYMPQKYEEEISSHTPILSFIFPHGNQEEITKARMYLGNMHLTKEEMTGNFNDLSNGTKVKVILIKFVLNRCNVLILDEPTRNVSPLSNPVIRKMLSEFGGTIISVSHDRRYLEEVVDVIYELTPDGLFKK